MTRDEPVRVSAESVTEAARRLGPEYNYNLGFQDGLAAGNKLWKVFTLVAVLFWAVSLAMMIIAIIY